MRLLEEGRKAGKLLSTPSRLEIEVARRPANSTHCEGYMPLSTIDAMLEQRMCNLHSGESTSQS
jgi:hypothetical protein